jgi:hypothetical protein
VDVIILSIHLDQFSPEILAHVGEDHAEIGKRCLREHAPAIFCDEDQMDVHRKNAVSSFPVAIVICHRTIYHCAMITRKANPYRPYPTPEQAQQMAQIAGSCRYVFNLALEQRRDWWRPGRTFNFASQ